MGARQVILSRAAKLKGAPTVVSRFVQRLAAVAGAERWHEVCRAGERYLAWARAIDHPPQVAAAPRPAPKPPRDVRPSALPLTDIEHWLRDPYTIYAKHVLRLAPLDPVYTAPGAADRGTLIHGAIADFTKKFSAALPANPLDELVALGRAWFAPLEAFPEARAFWWPRFRRIARWFSEWEAERRRGMAALHAEIRGEIPIPLGERTFRLSARADRIERRKDGSYAILDYKTGQPPSEPQVRSGLAPQLTLEAAILRHGGFPGIAPGSVSEIGYVRLKGGDPPGEPKTITLKDGTPDSYADTALQKLTGIALKFLVDGEPYRSLVHPMWKKHYGDYDHLARVKEWSLSGGAEDEEATE